ncbi:MAG: type II toxin-antitoxin system VapC family toxin [Actinomycetota bacterium]
MTEAVLDASVVLKWFAPKAEVSSERARIVRERHRAGELIVIVPSLLFLEILNVAGRRWTWPEADLLDLAASLKMVAFDVAEADLEDLTPWIAWGLSAYDAAYVALAESRGIPLLTEDDRILAVAPETAIDLASI